jgi:hypothetical protein
VVVARRQRENASRGRGIGRDDAVELGIVLVIAQADVRESGAEREG